MIYQFRCNCVESRHFRLEVAADSHHTFQELHHLIQSALGFHNFQLASFFIPLAYGRKSLEISQIDGHNSPRMLSMRKTLIGEVINPTLRFFRYVFDFISDRYLQIELTGTIMEKSLREPVVNLQMGESPVQLLDDVITADLPEATPLTDEESDYGMLTDYYEIFGEMEGLIR